MKLLTGIKIYTNHRYENRSGLHTIQLKELIFYLPDSSDQWAHFWSLSCNQRIYQSNEWKNIQNI